MEKKDLPEADSKPGCLKRISNGITNFLARNFERLGRAIGRRPWRFIAGCLVVVALCGLGMLRFTEVSNPDSLWVPDNAEVLKHKNWVDANFPSTTRAGVIIGVSGNVLTPTGLGALLDLYQSIMTTNTSGIGITDVCTMAGTSCIVTSILELWSYDDTTIRGKSQADIISDVNSITTSPMYQTTVSLPNLLGERTVNANGEVTAASAAIMTFLLKGTDDIKDDSEAWEQVLIDIGKAGHSDLTNTYVFAVRSFSDEAGGAIQSDVVSLSIGYFIVIIFVMLVLGKFNLMEQRIWLSLGGILCIGLSIVVSFGLSSAIGMEYGPLHSILPFLLLGIGVDDMFVLMGAYENLREDERGSVEQTLGKVLGHAGVSITVTSITDFVAFLIGATTLLPALQSFCVFAAFGILGLFCLQAIFFTACLGLNIQLQKSGRDACCCCYTHKPTYTPCKASNTQLIPLIFRKVIDPALSFIPFKILVVVSSLTLLGINIWGFVNLEQYFDRNWFLPTDSYAYSFAINKEKYFPDDGAKGAVYCGNIDYYNSETKMDSLYSKLSGSQYMVNGTVDSWFQSLTDWLSTTATASVTALIDPSTKYPTSEVNFVNLTHDLATTQQTRHALNLMFSQSYGDDITASKIPFQHTYVRKTSDQITILDTTRQNVLDAGFTEDQCFPYSRNYLTWETNRVIQEELYRNLGLACLCVFIVTLVLIAHIGTSVMVFLCVIFTLVDVAGTMHLWGLTIDTVTSIQLIIAIGLAVDYSAHIGHFFMTVSGTRAERMSETVREMGPPVFYGAFSTFLAFVLLAGSNSYVFTTFFKVFLLVVMYGVFHGLVLLPVILSWMGPDPYPSATPATRPSTASTSNVVIEPQQTKIEMGNGVPPKSSNGMVGPRDTKTSNGHVGPWHTSTNVDLSNNAIGANGHVAGGQRANGSRGSATTPPPDYSPPSSRSPRGHLTPVNS